MTVQKRMMITKVVMADAVGIWDCGVILVIWE